MHIARPKFWRFVAFFDFMRRPRTAKRFDAFISYKHESGTGFAVPLARTLQRYAKFFLARSRTLFRDEEYLKPGIDLPEMIREALEDAEFLILLASPEAAKSGWVASELKQWCGMEGRTDKLIIVLTEGKIATDATRGKIAWDETTALPLVLREYVSAVPYYVDLSWTDRPSQFNLQDPRFKSAVNAIVARLENVEPHAMLGIQADAYRKNRRLGVASACLISVLMLLAGLFAWTTSVANRNLVDANQRLRASLIAALSESVAARDPTVAFRLAQEAQAIQPSFTSAKTLFRTYNSNALFYEELYRDVADADLSADGRHVLVVTGVFETPTARLIDLGIHREVKLDIGDEKQVGGRFVNKDSRVLTWSSTGRLSLWELNGTKVADMQTSMDELSRPDFDASRDVVVGARFDKIDVWDLQQLEHREIDVAKANQGQARVFVACSPSGNEVAEYRYDGTSAAVWSMKGELKYTLSAAGELKGIAYSPKGDLIAVYSANQVTIWKDGQSLAILDSANSEITSAAFTANSVRFMMTRLNGEVAIYEVANFDAGKDPVATVFRESPRAIDVLAPSRTSKMVALGHRTGIVSVYGQDRTLQFTLVGHSAGDGLNNALERVAWSTDDSKLLTVARDQTARVWSLGSARFRFVRNSSEINHSLVSMDRRSQQIAFGVNRKTGKSVEIYDFDGNLRRALGSHTSFIRSVLFARNGSIVTHSNDRMQIWPANGDPIVIPSSPEHSFTGQLSFAEDEKLLVLNDVFQKGKLQGIWTMQGEPVEQSVLAGAAVAVDKASSRSDVNWIRTDTGSGFVVYDQTKSDQVFVGASLDGANVVSKRLDELGYAHAEGDNGVEWFLFDADRIISLEGRPEVDSLIWRPDAVERNKLGLDQNRQGTGPFWETVLASFGIRRTD
jgi:WD40 repeat protein